MSKRLSYLAGLFVLALLTSTAQEAGAMNLASTSCSWSGVVGGAFVNFPAPAGQLCSVRWGTVSPQVPAGQSGLDFLGGAPITPIPEDTNFVLGTLTHVNAVIAGTTANGDAPSAAVLTFLPIFSSPALAPTLILNFVINETANLAPCPVNLGPDCADIISFPGAFPSFEIGAVTLSIIGFGADGSLSQFISPEGGSNSTPLIARIHTRVVPNPSALLLIGLGLVGLAGINRIRSRQN